MPHNPIPNPSLILPSYKSTDKRRCLLLLSVFGLDASSHDLLVVPLARPVAFGQANLVDFVADLHPHVARRWYRADLAQQPVHDAADDEPGKVVEVVDVGCAGRHLAADGPREAHDVDEDSRNVCGVAAPVEAGCEEVGGTLAARVELLDVVVALADDVVVAEHDSCNRRKENRVGGKIGGKIVAGVDQVPRTHAKSNQCTDVASAADIDVTREQSSHVSSSGHRVGCNVGAELGERKGGSDYKDSKSVGVRVFPVEHHGQKIERVPDWVRIRIDDLGRRRDDDANERGDGKSNGNGEELRPKRTARRLCKSGKVGVVDNQGAKVGDRAHDALDDLPREGASLERCSLVDNGTESASFGYEPNEECHGGNRDNVGFDGEKMANLVDWKPNGRKTE